MKLNGNNGEHRHIASNNKADTPKTEKAPGGGKRALRRSLVTLGIIAVVVIGVIIGYSLWETPPDVVGPGSNPSSGAAISSPTETDKPAPGDSSQASEQSDDPGTTPTEEPVDEYEGALVTDRDDGVYTFLLVGRDYASNSTDTIIVGKFDTNKHTIDMVNIPRDTLININWSGSPKRINSVYPGYVNGGKPGIDGLLPEIRKLIGFDVDFYAVVNLKVVVEVIDEIGGVDFDVPIDMHYDDYGQSFHVHLEKGYQHLNGYEALGVFRFRNGGYHNGVLTEGYPGGDVQRIETQQALLKAIAKQLLSLGNIPNLGNIIDLCLSNVETTLDASNMAFFARQFLKCSMDGINFHEMPWSGFNLINYVSYVSIDPEPWLDVINEYLNPYSEDVKMQNLSILSGNYEGTYLTATNGVIAGGWESFWCQQCGSAHLPAACPMDAPAEEDPGAEGDTGTQTPPEETPADTPDQPENTTEPAPEGESTSD